MNHSRSTNNTSAPHSSLLGGLVLVTGIVIGAATTWLIKETRPKKAGIALELAKKRLAHKGTVIGSWIDYDPIPYDVFEDQPLVYLGGITLTTPNGETAYYQFASDIYSGEVIDYYLAQAK